MHIYLSINPSVRPPVRPPACPSVYQSVCQPVCPSVRRSDHTSICRPIRPFVFPSSPHSAYLFVCPSTHPPIYPSVHLFVSRVSIDLSICLPVYWSIDVFSFFSCVFLLFLQPGFGLSPRPSESVVAVLQQLWGWWRNTLTSNSCAHRFVHSLLSRFKVGISLSTTAEEHASEYMILPT